MWKWFRPSKHTRDQDWLSHRPLTSELLSNSKSQQWEVGLNSSNRCSRQCQRVDPPLAAHTTNTATCMPTNSAKVLLWVPHHSKPTDSLLLSVVNQAMDSRLWEVKHNLEATQDSNHHSTISLVLLRWAGHLPCKASTQALKGTMPLKALNTCSSRREDTERKNQKFSLET